MVELCQECLHMIFEDICRCTEGRVIGCMYIGLVEGCIYYDIQTKKRCKNRVIETENGKLHMCIEHGSKKKVHIKTESNKKSEDSNTIKKKVEKEVKEVDKKVKQKRKIVRK